VVPRSSTERSALRPHGCSRPCSTSCSTLPGVRLPLSSGKELLSSCCCTAGDIQLAVVMNYMVDMGWLLSACPALLKAGSLLVVHGERQEREAAIRVTAQAAGGRQGGGRAACGSPAAMVLDDGLMGYIEYRSSVC
jgi:hypothetical protein